MFSGSLATFDFQQGLGNVTITKSSQNLSLDNNELNPHEVYILVKNRY